MSSTTTTLDSIRNKGIMFEVIKYVSLIIVVFIALVPIVVVFFASFKGRQEFVLSDSVLTLPKSFLNFANYKRAFIDGMMLRGFMNTAILLVSSMLGAILLGTMTAYVLNRFKSKATAVIMAAFMFATLIPGVTTQVAVFKIINFLGIYNTYLAPIILYMGTDITSVYIFIQFLNSVSISLDEAAMIEGASFFKIYWSIILPLLKPAIATVVIVKGVGIYNDFYTPFLYMPKRALQTVSTSLFRFKGPYGTEWETISAGIMIAIIPTIIIFLFMQKFFYNGFTAGQEK